MTHIDQPPAGAFPAHIEQQLATLRTATDEQTRLDLENVMTPTDADKPLDASQEVSDTELAAVDAAAAAADKSGPATKVVKAANGQVGYHEQGTNCTKYGSWYGIHCAEWCDMFVSWVFNEASQLHAIGGKHSYVPSHLDWFRQHNRFHARGAKGGGPRLGCVVFFDLNGHDGADHIGIVVAYNDTHVYTVEGNRSNQVKRANYTRSSHQIYGYGYPNWS